MSKKKKGGDHGGGGGHDGAGGLRWLLTYTDMVTLLLALFIVMWASADPNPPFTSPKWTVGNIARIFDHGWNLEWIADDFVSRWRFPHRYQYIAIQWGGPRAMIADGDTEIDAVCAPRTEDD